VSPSEERNMKHRIAARLSALVALALLVGNTKGW
jgi:hypothetical protein